MLQFLYQKVVCRQVHLPRINKKKRGKKAHPLTILILIVSAAVTLPAAMQVMVHPDRERPE